MPPPTTGRLVAGPVLTLLAVLLLAAGTTTTTASFTDTARLATALSSGSTGPGPADPVAADSGPAPSTPGDPEGVADGHEAPTPAVEPPGGTEVDADGDAPRDAAAPAGVDQSGP